MNLSKLILIGSVVMTCCLNVFCGETDTSYSVKNRWVVKVSASAYRCMLFDIPDFYVGEYEKAVTEQGLNMRFETNYAFSKNMEVGVFAGFQCARYGFVVIDEMGEATDASFKKAISPVFGVNIQLQILPFFVKSNVCRWDLYLTANYAGGIFKHYKEMEISLTQYPLRYRHTYGFGLGLSYYFKNMVGLFGELCVGNFSYFPDYVESNVNFRGGVAAKF